MGGLRLKGLTVQIDLPYLMQDIDRHGNVRLYVRRKGRKARLKLPPGAPAFMAEYNAALERLNAGENAPEAGRQTGTMGWLAKEYHASPQFTRTDQRQQRMRMLALRSALDETTKPGSKLYFRDCPVSEFTADHVRLLRNRKKDTPAAANRRVAEFRKLLAWAVEERGQWVKRNVAADVKGLAYDKEGFRAWTHEDVSAFEAKWPVGSTPRLALAIMLFTGVRRSDAVRLGPPMVNDGSITFMPEKTRKQKKELTLPILPALQDVIAKTPTGLKTWLVTQYGKPFTAPGFGNWFRDKCNEAGLKECTAHGVRKIAAETAAENHATEKEMLDIFGWTKADLAAYYSRNANQKKIAANAMHKLIPIGS